MYFICIGIVETGTSMHDAMCTYVPFLYSECVLESRGTPTLHCETSTCICTFVKLIPNICILESALLRYMYIQVSPVQDCYINVACREGG